MIIQLMRSRIVVEPAAKRLYDQISDAKRELEFAEQNMNNAAPEYVDVAVHLYDASLERYSVLVKEAKEAGLYA